MNWVEYERHVEADVKAAVERGADVLDHWHPGWDEKIDVDKLDITDVNACVLGQLFYEEARKDKRDWIANGYDYAMENHWGLFAASTVVEAFCHGRATKYWRELILARREGALVPLKSDHALTA